MPGCDESIGQLKCYTSKPQLGRRNREKWPIRSFHYYVKEWASHYHTGANADGLVKGFFVMCKWLPFVKYHTGANADGLVKGFFVICKWLPFVKYRSCKKLYCCISDYSESHWIGVDAFGVHWVQNKTLCHGSCSVVVRAKLLSKSILEVCLHSRDAWLPQIRFFSNSVGHRRPYDGGGFRTRRCEFRWKEENVLKKRQGDLWFFLVTLTGLFIRLNFSVKCLNSEIIFCLFWWFQGWFWLLNAKSFMLFFVFLFFFRN